ncbi:DEAD/DEAH box helicase [Lysinibacillus telephonicus]|uniref:Helicase SNF n=1 Tax=Lysinibacillus telephonicus TaxID=1714840 RepID=A0A3S0JM57_9BACI|nr:DEAD/DEAH box helicase [Lysinibacillus telephonicus]RTQ89362.1 helicase SNF [Lysinibacillus telephonicus]
MNIKLNQKIIKEMCGTVSFKRGDSFYRAGKVSLLQHNEEFCKAIVHGTEDYHVTIRKEDSGGIKTACTCPSLPNFKYCCQHTAAVLIAIYEHKKQGNITSQVQPSNNHNFTDTFMTLFSESKRQTSGHQLHFEKREIIDVHFTLKPILIATDEYLFGIELEIAQTQVPMIREFLQDVSEGKSSNIFSVLEYDPNLHCFTEETDALIHQLIHVVLDEKAYIEAIPNRHEYTNRNQTLLISPTAWLSLLPMLTKVPFIKLEEENNQILHGLHIQVGPPPLHFYLEKGKVNNYRLTVKGLDQLIPLSAYHSVIKNGEIFQLEGQDFERLMQLKQMLQGLSAAQIPIQHEQIDFFLKKVVPGLKRIGTVQVSDELTQNFMRTPLVAKIYLDRLKNRLLAGLEFHYENIVIQPLESRDIPKGPMIIRDLEKENEILELMEQSGFTITEGGYYMQNEELEYDFLYHQLPNLQQLAQIYATTAVRTRIMRENATPRIRIKVPKERTDWLEFKFEMDGIPDKQIKEILAALQLKQKYYRLPNGSLLSLETKEMEEIHRFLNAIPIQDDHYEATLNMPIKESLRFLDLLEDEQIFTVEESFQQFVHQLLEPKNLDFVVPEQLNDILREYQKQGYKWMKALATYGVGGVLADDMGLGKTLQSIAFIVSELSTIRRDKHPVLIVCPSSLTYNWLQEIMTFAPELQAIVIDGNQAERQKIQQSLEDIDVIITSYPLLRRDLKWYEKQIFHTVFFDEAQAFKNPITQTSRAVKKIQAKNRFGLTGTPIENSLEELWSIYHVVFPHLFQGLEEYSHLTRKAIARRVRPFLLRRVKADVLTELPQKQEFLELSELLPEQKKLYLALLAKLRHDTLKHLDKETYQKNRIRILAGLTRLRQICCHPSLFIEGYSGSSAKFEQLLRLVEESRLSGRRVLIFSQFTKMLELIGRELTMRGHTYFYLDGNTPSEKRLDLCNRFNDGERDLFLISLKAGGTGLNLTGADTVILYDLWWNPAVEAQAADRAYRIGQKNTVQVIKLVARGTIEERINALQEKKKNLISDILNEEENTSAALTEEDIREILMI